jgi:hypothetical protein
MFPINPYSSPTVSEPKPRSESEKSNNALVVDVSTVVVFVGKIACVVAILYIYYIYIYYISNT